ncbi:hypothetical protein V2I01_23525 [Micromonospora sp. BRA006-A]|nr:hypothetical protein [Micromonospora sp. BRA006-A]
MSADNRSITTPTWRRTVRTLMPVRRAIASSLRPHDDEHQHVMLRPREVALLLPVFAQRPGLLPEQLEVVPQRSGHQS